METKANEVKINPKTKRRVATFRSYNTVSRLRNSPNGMTQATGSFFIRKFDNSLSIIYTSLTVNY